ncbi:hypothetical protein ARNL5_01099 [Anaerolineae bacterium]|nr:hypothetical protein ARNL5_01099 [Anaerolineae bacterium]
MATTSYPSDRLQSDRQPVSGVVTALRGLHLLLVLLFAGAVILQVFFAGATLLADPRYLIDHRSLGTAMGPLPALIVIVSLIGRLPRRIVMFSILIFVLYAMQYVIVYMLPSLGLPAAFRALHAVNALLMFWTALHLAKLIWRALLPKSRGE